jgi:predicted transcriptional regulator
MATHVRKNVVLSQDLDQRLRRLARERGSSQSGLISHLLALGLAAEDADGDPLLRYLGAVAGPAELSSSVDKTVYRR